jgi:hypothetical protein
MTLLPFLLLLAFVGFTVICNTLTLLLLGWWMLTAPTWSADILDGEIDW